MFFLVSPEPLRSRLSPDVVGLDDEGAAVNKVEREQKVEEEKDLQTGGHLDIGSVDL